MTNPRLKITVGIATAGRQAILRDMVRQLSLQTRPPDALIICPLPCDDVDAAMFSDFPAATRVVTGPSGLCAQRNLILAAAQDTDIIVFFDDDFLAAPDYLATVESIFSCHADVTGVTGHLLADGIHGPGLSVSQALELLHSVRSAPLTDFEPRAGTYGCNMAFRMAPIRANQMRFDENLPLYGWQEDIDFSLRQSPFGRTLKCNRLIGVHLGVKSGRASGVRFGYSQIANPIYLIRKGTMSWRHAKMLMWRNIASNLVRSFYPEPWIDRKGRLKGNLIALADVVTSRLSPLRILQL
jgi:glycosyltransferase involved in cell wall biosynthesis